MERAELEVGKEYMNLKTRNTYTVLRIVRDSETLEERVVYEETPAWAKKDLPWDRPLALFLEKFERLYPPCMDCGLGREGHREKVERYGRCYFGG
jgi:hypothetical protein